MRRFSFVLAILPGYAATLIAVPASASTYVVRPDGTGDYATIQEALDAAIDGDVIELANGVFIGSRNRDLDGHGKRLIVQSESGTANSCIVDCQMSGRGFIFQSGETSQSLLQSITIRNGLSSAGGAVVCRNASSPQINLCTFDHNSADYGGALFCSDPSSSVSVSGCRFSDNSASNKGGGIYCGYECAIWVSESIILNNQAGVSGGAIFCDESALVLEACIISGNAAAQGGGIYCFESTATLSGCTVTGNVAGTEGGGLFCRDIPLGQPHIVSCTFFGNSAGEGGGGLFCGGQALPTIQNTIFAFGVGGGAIVCVDPASVPTLLCCDLYGNSGGDWLDCIADQRWLRGNISEDPHFCSPIEGDFTLRSDSPCRPEHDPECGLLGAWPVACSPPTRTLSTTWGLVKAGYR